MTKPDDKLLDIEYEELSHREPLSNVEMTEEEKQFLLRVLGPERLSWSERGRKYGYGWDYDPEENVEE